MILALKSIRNQAHSVWTGWGRGHTVHSPVLETCGLRVHDDCIQTIFGVVPFMCSFKLKVLEDRESNQSDVREN